MGRLTRAVTRRNDGAGVARAAGSAIASGPPAARMAGTMKTRLRSTFVAAALFLVTACAGTSNSTSSSTGQAAVNAKCPMSGEDVDKACTTQWNGSTVAFCCNNCIGKFNKLSDADKKAKVAAAMPMK